MKTIANKLLTTILILICFCPPSFALGSPSNPFPEKTEMEKLEDQAKELFSNLQKDWRKQSGKLYEDAYEWAKAKGIISSTYKAKNWAIENGLLNPALCVDINKDLTKEEIVSNKAFCQNFTKSSFKDVEEDVNFVILNSSQRRDIVYILFDDFLKTSEPICYNEQANLIVLRRLFKKPHLAQSACENPCFSYKLHEALMAFFMKMQTLH